MELVGCSMLVNGNIPRGMKCPFKNVCCIAMGEYVSCSQGENEFSCAAARAYNTILVRVKMNPIGGKTGKVRQSFVNKLGLVVKRDAGHVWVACLGGDEKICVTEDSIKYERED